MAKTKMICPFSKELCRECPQYRGRHYYLCFCTKYRGYLGDKEEQGEKKSGTSRINKKFGFPPLPKPSSTWLVLNDFAEGREK
ncbi:MAG: hypothetical protein JRJ29_02125 [Deltaproteobacteria bacterium]|nr:hypothetical protein [Deltaproteobacteria bacterium]